MNSQPRRADRKASVTLRPLLVVIGVFAVFSGGCADAPPAADVASAADVERAEVWRAGPALPRPVANNAVVGVDTDQGPAVFSMLGIDTTRAWDGVVSWSFRWNVRDSAWVEVSPVPGPGRLAGTAQAWGGRVYLLGGYTVAEDGSEASVPTVDVYDPGTDQWSTAAPMPVPVDDAVSGIWRDSLIVLVSGWHDTDNVSDVQIYDPARDRWTAATPIPGPAVFGHTGAVSGDIVIYRDGARVRDERPRFVLSPSAWRGALDPDVPGAISWRQVAEPAPALYRAAALAVGDWVLFAGGTDNAYNYNGIGYDGRAAEPRANVLGYHVPTDRWVQGPRLPAASMDHRSLARAGEFAVLAGGMGPGQRVSDRVWVADVDDLIAAFVAEPNITGGTGPSGP